MDELNKILNNCSKIKSGYCYSCQCNAFSYNLSYVHMMLASALMTMIDKCECVFFLNTPSSINLNNKLILCSVITNQHLHIFYIKLKMD